MRSELNHIKYTIKTVKKVINKLTNSQSQMPNTNHYFETLYKYKNINIISKQ